jgi:protease II
LLEVIENENTYANRWFSDSAGLEAKLLTEIRERITERRKASPVAAVSQVRVGKGVADYSEMEGAIRYHSDEGMDQTLLRIPGNLLQGAKVLQILPAEDLSRFAVLFGGPRNRILLLDRNGGELDRFEVRDPDELRWAWSGDGSTLLYVDPFDDPGNRTVWNRKNGNTSVFFRSEDESSYVVLDSTRDRNFIRISVTGFHLEYPVIYDRDLQIRFQGRSIPGTFTEIEPRGSEWILKSNRRGRFASVYRLPGLARDDTTISKSNRILEGSESLDYSPDRNLEENTPGLDCYEDFCAIGRKNRGHPEWVILDRSGKATTVFRDPNSYSFLQTSRIDSPTAKEIHFEVQSFLEPHALWRYRLGDRKARRVEEAGSPGTSPYGMEQREFRARDGVRIPVTLVRKSGTPDSPRTPLFAQVYGAYGADFYINYDVAFNFDHAASLLDRGFVFAFIHARGGGELGLHWFLDGTGANKSRTIDDFEDALRGLIRSGVSSPDSIAIGGFSAGGNPIGNALSRFPDLFRAALIQQGFLDLLGSQSDPAIPFVKLEWPVWGNPFLLPDFERMEKMDPYRNLRPRSYPMVFLRTSMDDSTVLVQEGVKFVSRLRTERLNPEVPTVLQVLPKGLGGHDGRYENYEIDAARNFTFLIRALQSR